MANEENVSRGDQWNPFGPDAGNASDNSDSTGMTVSPVDDDEPVPAELDGRSDEGGGLAKPVPPTSKKEKQSAPEEDLFEPYKTNEPGSEPAQADSQGQQPPSDFDPNDPEYRSVNGLFDVFVEDYGWGDVPQDKRPRNFQEFAEFVTAMINENSVPQYATNTARELDTYVRNGGREEDFFGQIAQNNPAAIDTTTEYGQQRTIAQYLAMQGWDENSIRDRIQTFSKDKDILKKESEYAANALRSYDELSRQQMVQEQQQLAQQEQRMNEDFMKATIQVLSTQPILPNLELNNQQKRDLFQYMFAKDNEGLSQFMRDYSSHPMHAIRAAAFCRYGDQLVSRVEGKAQKRAIDRLREDLRKNQETHSRGPTVQSATAAGRKGNDPRPLGEVFFSNMNRKNK